MKTLLLHDGDLVLASGGYQTVTGARQIQQDLSYALREPYGTDRFHPRWGTILDDFIGQPFTSDLTFHVEGEVSRVVQNYMTAQGQSVQADVTNNSRTRWTTDGIIRTIDQVVSRRQVDRIEARLTVTTLAGTPVNVEVATA